MKKIISTLVLTIAVATSAGAQKAFKLEGKVSPESSNAKILVFVADEEYNIAEESAETLEVKKGKFSCSIKLTDPRPGRLTLMENDAIARQYFITMVPGETAKLTIVDGKMDMDGTSFYKQEGTLSKMMLQQTTELQKIVDEYRAAGEGQDRDEIVNKFNTFRDEYTQKINDYMLEHSDEEGVIVGAITTMGATKEYYDKASERVKNGRFSKFLAHYLAEEKARIEARESAERAAKEAEEKSAEGEMFVDFEAEYDGKVQKLSDYVGRGKYVLVDFWASWCGPCKAEIPHIKEVYEKYKGDNFEVLGVATWDKPENTLEAIEALGIEYPQIMNAQKAGSDAYGIQGIPQIILFGPDGKVLKRNLRGENIEKEVSKYLD